MRDFRWVCGQVAEVQRFINVPRRWCEHYPARERRELWITADQGPEFKFVVHTTLMPARRGHRVLALLIGRELVALHNLQTGESVNYLRSDLPLLWRRCEVVASVLSLVATLYGVFGDAQWSNKERLSDALLKDLIEHFSKLPLGNHNVTSDLLGDAYEYLIKKFADATNKKAGEFYTPRSVVRLMIDMLAPKALRVPRAPRLVRSRMGEARRNRYEHVSPDTLNVALRRLKLLDIEHFTVHDMRRTARTHLAGLGVDSFVAERSLIHKLGNVEGIYRQHDYFAERAAALGTWASLLAKVERGMVLGAPAKATRQSTRRTASERMLVNG